MMARSFNRSQMVLWIALAIPLAAPAARAEVIYDTLIPAVGGAFSTEFGNTFIGLGFATTATDFRLTAIDVGMSTRGPDSETSPSGNVAFSIYAADQGFGNQVGALVQQIASVPALDLYAPSSQNPSYSIPSVNVELQPSTFYYLVANYPQGSGTGDFLVWFQASGIPSTNPAYNYRYSDSADGTTWNFPQLNNANPLKATISAVPEPSTCGMALAAIAGLASIRFRRRKHQA
jgi:hypothetical protein